MDATLSDSPDDPSETDRPHASSPQLLADAADVVDSILQAPVAAVPSAQGAGTHADADDRTPDAHRGRSAGKGRGRKSTGSTGRKGRESAAPSGRTRAAEARTLSGAPIGGPPGTSGTADAPGADGGVDYSTLARVTVVSLTSGLRMAFGEHWNANGPETDAMVDAWAAYFRARGIRDVPPEVMLAGAMTAYVGPRLARPESRSAIARAWTWWKDRRAQRRGPVGDFGDARAGGRTDGNGEDDAPAGTLHRLPGLRDSRGRLDTDPPRV